MLWGRARSHGPSKVVRLHGPLGGDNHPVFGGGILSDDGHRSGFPFGAHIVGLLADRRGDAKLAVLTNPEWHVWRGAT
jgi:hypothetical protein